METVDVNTSGEHSGRKPLRRGFLFGPEAAAVSGAAGVAAGCEWQFGHNELIYSRPRNHVPAHSAWTIRHHGASLRMAEPYLHGQDRLYRDRYLARFQIYDQGLKLSGRLPRVEMTKYRPLIEDTFPHPILL